jgi:hypothetical protein
VINTKILSVLFNHDILSKDWECIIEFVQEITCWALQRQPTLHPEQNNNFIIRNRTPAALSSGTEHL